MDGIHDLGGVEGFGPPAWEGPDEPVFRHDGERRAMGLTFCGIVMGLGDGTAAIGELGFGGPETDYEHLAMALHAFIEDRGLV